MVLITWASIISKEQDKVLGNFKFHVDDPLKANLQFFDHFSANNVFGHNHNPSMTNYSNLSIFSISRISLCSHHHPFFLAHSLYIFFPDFNNPLISSGLSYLREKIQIDENTSLNAQFADCISLVHSFSCVYI